MKYIYRLCSLGFYGALEICILLLLLLLLLPNISGDYHGDS